MAHAVSQRSPLLGIAIRGEWHASDLQAMMNSCNVLYNGFMLIEFSHPGLLAAPNEFVFQVQSALETDSLRSLSKRVDDRWGKTASLPRLRVHRLQYASPGIVEMAGLLGALVPLGYLLNKSFELHLQWQKQTEEAAANRMFRRLKALDYVIGLCAKLRLSEEATRRVVFEFDEHLAVFSGLVSEGKIAGVQPPTDDDHEVETDVM